MKKQVTAWVFLLGIITGAGLVKLFTFSTATTPFIKQPEIISAERQEKRATEKEDRYKNKMKVLQTKEAIIAGQLNNTKQLLKQAQSKALILQNYIRDMVAHNNKTGDKPFTILHCDTLNKEVNKMLLVQTEKDSLGNTVTAMLEQQLHNKDTIIELHQQQYGSLKTAFESSLSQQKRLEEQLGQYNRYFKRQKLKKKITALGVIVLSAFTAKYLLR